MGIIIELLLLWYLTRPGVKAAFTPGARTQGSRLEKSPNAEPIPRGKN